MNGNMEDFNTSDFFKVYKRIPEDEKDMPIAVINSVTYNKDGQRVETRNKPLTWREIALALSQMKRLDFI